MSTNFRTRIHISTEEFEPTSLDGNFFVAKKDHNETTLENIPSINIDSAAPLDKDVVDFLRKHKGGAIATVSW